MSKRVFKSTMAVVVAMGLAMPLMSASATETSDVAVRVSFADLDVSKRADAEQLYERLQHVAEQICGSRSYTQLGSLSRVADAEACYKQTLARSVAKVGSDTLNRIHTG